MPAEMTETDEMADAFYSSPEGEEVVEETETTKETPESVDEEEAQNPTALLPTSALGKGVKVGDSISIKVVKIYDDEAEVEISSGKPPTEEPQSADMEIDAMAVES